MIIMECRLINLQYALDGFLKTHIPLISWNGTTMIPFLGADDIGIYVFIPKLVKMLGISLGQAINIFFYTLMGTGFFLGFLGLALLYNKMHEFCLSAGQLLFLAYFMIHYAIGDVYLAYFAAPLGLIPLFLYFYRRNFSYAFCFYLSFAGCIVGFLHYIRSFSSLGTLLFMLCMLIMHREFSHKKKLSLLFFLIIGLTCPVLYFQSIIKTYTKYAQTHIPEYKELPTAHPFWHNIYLGFGFLNFENKKNIQMNDEYAFAKVKEINPTISLHTINQYEEILKNEIFSLCKTKPFFVLFTLFAKIGILFLYLLLFANVGLFALFLRSKDWCFEISYTLAFIINSAFPLLTLPNYGYSIGFISLATVYGILSCNEFLRQTTARQVMIPI